MIHFFAMEIGQIDLVFFVEGGVTQLSVCFFDIILCILDNYGSAFVSVGYN